MKKLIILVLILLVGVASFARQVTAQDPAVNQENLVYSIRDSKVTSTGEVIQLKEGVWKRNITVEATAILREGSMFSEGKFELKYDAFSPSFNMGPQKKGMWYIVGTWTITDANAQPVDESVNHDPSVATGDVMAELPFDPSLGSRQWTSKAAMRMGQANGRWSRGEGTLSLDETMQGEIFLSLMRWPEMGQ